MCLIRLSTQPQLSLPLLMTHLHFVLSLRVNCTHQRSKQSSQLNTHTERMSAIDTMMVASSFLPLLAALMLTIGFLKVRVRETHSFATRAKSKNMSLVEMRRQSLSRTKKSNVSNNAPPSKHDSNQIQTDNASLSRAYLY